MGTRIKLVMPTFVRMSGHGNKLYAPSPKLVVGDKSFKVMRTDYNYGTMEITIVVNTNDLDIIKEEDE